MNMMAAWLSFQLANLVVRKMDNVKAARGEHVKGKKEAPSPFIPLHALVLEFSLFSLKNTGACYAAMDNSITGINLYPLSR